MGTSLVVIGNHNIDFIGRDFKPLAEEIRQRLNAIQFVNAEYLRMYALHCQKSAENRWVREIRKLKAKMDWSYLEDNPEYDLFTEESNIEFIGPFDLSIDFCAHYIYFWNPSLRYQHWIEEEYEDAHLYKNEWRKYLYQVVHAFGGDRVIYLADNAHPLDGYGDRDIPFKDIEASLLERFGPPKKTFKEVADNYHNSYFIDYLEDIAWDVYMPLEDYYPEPDDLSSIDFNLNDFKTKEQLIQVKWLGNKLLHKRIDGKVHFWHIAQYVGVLVTLEGVVGESEKIIAVLDPYAPFTFDDMVAKKLQEGFGKEDLPCYTLYFWDDSHIREWHNAIGEFKVKLFWSGNGEASSGFGGALHWGSHFYAANEAMALELFLNIAREHHASGPLKIVRGTHYKIKEGWEIVYEQ